jgi:hypothetical protein
MVLECNKEHSEIAQVTSKQTSVVCRDQTSGLYSHSGRVSSSGKTIRFQVDHASVHASDENALSAEYSLDGERLTLIFDSAQNEGTPRLRGHSTWQRIARIATANAALPPAGECQRSGAPTLDRSYLSEARVDK